MKKYLKSIGWVKNENVYYLIHPIHGEYQLYFDKTGGYFLGDDRDELECDETVKLTVEVIDKLYLNYILLGIRS